jgi:hypothetical protein
MGAAGVLQRPDVGAVVDLGRGDGVFPAMAAEQHHINSGDRAKFEG